MKYKLVLVTLLFVTNFAFCGVPPGSQGIGVNPPKAMLHVKGEILIDSVRSTPVQDGMIQYKSNQFLFRQNGAWLPLGSGSAGNVGSGMTKRNDTLIAGGRLKDLLLYQNSTDTIFGIDTLGNVYLPKVQELSEDDKSYFIDSNLTATRNSLKDSLVYWVFDNDPSVLCYGDSTGTTRKIRFRDNNRLIIDTLHFGSCTGNELYTLLLWKANPYTVPNGYYVDTFGALFSGYDTLNINGDASVESSYWFISDGHSFIDDPFDIDKPFTPLGNPYPIPGDTTSFLNRFFGKEKTFIDTMYVGVVIPLQDMHGYQQLIDKMVFIYPLKPKIYSLAITGDRIIKKNIVIKKNIESGGSSSNLIAGNGIGINSNEINLGDFTMDANINANNHNLSYNSLGMFNVQANSNSGNPILFSGSSNNHVAVSIQGDAQTFNGVEMAGSSYINSGIYHFGNSTNGSGIKMDGLSKNQYGISLNANCSSQSAPDMDINVQNGYLRFTNLPTDDASDYVLGRHGDKASWINRSAVGQNIYNVDGTLNGQRTVNTGNNRFFISSDIYNPGSGTEFAIHQIGSDYFSGMKRKGSDLGFGIKESGSGRGGYAYFGTIPDETNQTANGNFNPNIIITRIPDFVGSGHDFNSIDINAGGFGNDTTATLRISTNQNSAFAQMVAKTNVFYGSRFANQSNGFVLDSMFQITGPRLNNIDPTYVVTTSGNVGLGEIVTLTDYSQLISNIYNSDGDMNANRTVRTGTHSLSIGRDPLNFSADGSQLQLDSTNGYFQLGSTNSINGNTGLLGFNDGISMYTSIGSLMGSQANQGMTGYKDSVIIESGNLNYDFNGEASKIKLDRYDIRMGNRFRGVKDFTIIHNPLGAPNAPGLIGINTDAPLSTFHINTNDAMIIPKGTTGQRPTGIDGMLRFNTSTNGYEGYYSSGWQPFGNIYNTDGSVTANRTVDFTDKNLTFNGNVGAASRFYIQATENGTYSLGMGAIKSQGTSNNNYGISSIGSSANYSGHYISGSTIASSGSGYKGLWLYGTATENNTGVELYGYNSGNNSTAISIYGQSGAGYNHTDARSVQIFGDAIVEIGSNDEYIMVSSSSIAPNPSHNTDLGRKAKPFDSTYTNQVVATGIHADSVIMPIEVIPPGYFTPADGATISLTKSYNIVEPSGTLTALTVNMPSSPKNGQIVSIIFTETITSLTFANGTFVNPITTSSSVGGTVTWGYYSGTGKWYRK